MKIHFQHCIWHLIPDIRLVHDSSMHSHYLRGPITPTLARMSLIDRENAGDSVLISRALVTGGQARRHTCTHTSTHACTHTCTHARTHARTQARTQCKQSMWNDSGDIGQARVRTLALPPDLQVVKVLVL